MSLSSFGYKLNYGADTPELLNGCIVAGSLQRIAASLEAIEIILRDLCDPFREEKVAKIKKREADDKAAGVRWTKMFDACKKISDRLFADHPGDQTAHRTRKAAALVVGMTIDEASDSDENTEAFLAKVAETDWAGLDVMYYAKDGTQTAERIKETLARRRAEKAAATA